MTIAQRLEQLFSETAGPHGRPVTMKEIIQRMDQRGISSMSLSYLQQLRKGEAENPRLQHLRALADAFGVPLTYFLEDDPDDADNRELTQQERTLALRVHGLSDGALSSIRAVVELARKSEQLDEQGDPEGD
ncbi:helix-turn-helix domain-containing protein [Brevibacterium oceani]|uniref:helix-turn-helix domain-containing protein n=1 Tax=Brevibacterium oceani TaxID=358099 RepID=UPI0015E6998B|nr:hypothetical protein [Brevibacterium oceani]